VDIHTFFDSSSFVVYNIDAASKGFETLSKSLVALFIANVILYLPKLLVDSLQLAA